MINIDKYNPVQEHIYVLQKQLNEKYHPNKKIDTKYNNKCFISNLSLSDIKMDKNNYTFNDKGMLFFEADNQFFENRIKVCPVSEYFDTSKMILDSTLKRMYALIDFDYMDNGKLTEEEIDLCDNIFKSIYSKSISIKEKNIKKSIERFNNIQKIKHINKFVIRGVIYSIYEYYNSKVFI
ncbi:MAG: hypothetical protein AB1Z23_08785 [Eubacteriales bacterium]